MEMIVKTLVTALALAAMVASPAVAQKKSRQAAEQSFALAQPQQSAGDAWLRQRSANPTYDVYVNNIYLGSDPDVLVREELRRDGIVDR